LVTVEPPDNVPAAIRVHAQRQIHQYQSPVGLHLDRAVLHHLLQFQLQVAEQVEFITMEVAAAVVLEVAVRIPVELVATLL
jgi:hypothetical protein